MRYCSEPDCLQPAHSHGLCNAHRKRKEKGLQVSGAVAERGVSPRDVLRQASTRRENAETDEEYRLADDALKYAAVAYVARTPGAMASALAARRKREGKLAGVDLEKAVSMYGSLLKAAVALGVRPVSLRRRLAHERRLRRDEVATDGGQVAVQPPRLRPRGTRRGA